MPGIILEIAQGCTVLQLSPQTGFWETGQDKAAAGQLSKKIGLYRQIWDTCQL